MLHSGRYPREEKRLSGTMLLAGGVREWRVSYDPSGFFRGGIFRVSDVLAGGFDPGTTFINIHDKRLKYVVSETGIARKVLAKKRGSTSAKQKRIALMTNGIYLHSMKPAVMRARE